MTHTDIIARIDALGLHMVQDTVEDALSEGAAYFINDSYGSSGYGLHYVFEVPGEERFEVVEFDEEGEGETLLDTTDFDAAWAEWERVHLETFGKPWTEVHAG